MGKGEDTGWLKLYLEAVGRVISLDCCLDWILSPLLAFGTKQLLGRGRSGGHQNKRRSSEGLVLPS